MKQELTEMENYDYATGEMMKLNLICIHVIKLPLVGHSNREL